MKADLIGNFLKRCGAVTLSAEQRTGNTDNFICLWIGTGIQLFQKKSSFVRICVYQNHPSKQNLKNNATKPNDCLGGHPKKKKIPPQSFNEENSPEDKHQTKRLFGRLAKTHFHVNKKSADS